jgi:hypothetical protein
MKDNYMELINKFTRKEFKEDEVFAFEVILCDNKRDRDGEQFSDAALDSLKELFVGKTGIFDHDPRGENQTARVFDTEIVRTGEERQLKASCYMIRTGSNEDLIREIEGGIKKEVSVSCAVSRKLCSVCGKNILSSPCRHVKGRSYGGKVCTHILDGIRDAYEWSFVAVPAQPGAGVTKHCLTFNCEEEKMLKNEDLDLAEEEVRKDVNRPALELYDGEFAACIINIAKEMGIKDLITVKTILGKIAARRGRRQLSEEKDSEVDCYKI